MRFSKNPFKERFTGEKVSIKSGKVNCKAVKRYQKSWSHFQTTDYRASK